MIDQPSPKVSEKARRLLDQRRVILHGRDAATVLGDTGIWRVTASLDGLDCTCPAARWCSHRTAAAVAWSEAER